MALRQIKDGVVVSVYVKPSSSRDAISWVGDELQIQTKEPPAGNKANMAVIKMLAKASRVPQSSISLIRGQADRKKDLFVRGVLLKELEAALNRKETI